MTMFTLITLSAVSCMNAIHTFRIISQENTMYIINCDSGSLNNICKFIRGLGVGGEYTSFQCHESFMVFDLLLICIVMQLQFYIL